MLYTWDWSKEFRDYEAGLVPAHRLFGAADLPSFGLSVRTCSWDRAPNFVRHRQFWKIWQSIWVLSIQREISCVVATTEAPGVPVLFLRSIGIFRRPVIVLSVATLTDKYLSGVGGSIRRALLRRASVIVVYAKSQVNALSTQLGVRPQRVHFIPFGVDCTYFEPIPSLGEWDVVSVGTNEGKDFSTLVSALPQGTTCLIVSDKPNLHVAKSTPTAGRVSVDHDVPIDKLRALYAAARRVVIPLKDVQFSSGQTVLLETLAMGRPVIVSDVGATRDYVTDATATIVAPGDVDSLHSALLEAPPDHVPSAVAHVRSNFTSERFARDLATLCRETAARRIQARSVTVTDRRVGGGE